MKRYLTFFFLLITSIALCAYPEGAINNIDGSALGWDETNQVWRPIAVDATGKLSSGSSPAVASISIDTSNIDNKLVATFTDQFSTYQKTAGEMLKNISQCIEQVVDKQTKASQPNRLYMNRLSVSANSHYRIPPLGSSAIDNGRVFVELRAIDPDAEFYIGLDAMVTDLTGRPVKGRILINISADQDLYIYHTNASALAIQQTEGWN